MTQPHHTYQSISRYITNTLASAGIEDAHQEAEWIIRDACQLTKMDYLRLLSAPVPSRNSSRIYSILRKRVRRIPLAYITKQAFFRGDCYHIHPGVLIPRPETEDIIDALLQLSSPPQLPDIIFDVGCGSGILAIEAAKQFPIIPIYAWDISKRAVSTTNRNIVSKAISNITVQQGNFFSGHSNWKPLLQSSSNPIILSNPPYIPTADIAHLQPEVQKEPKAALDGGLDGLYFYRKLLSITAQYQATLICELGFGLAPMIELLLHDYRLSTYSIRCDLQNIPRILVVTPT